MAVMCGGDVERVPVTQEYMVEVLVADKPHPQKELFERALYDSIIRMVIGIANSYAVNSIDTSDDLVQECMRRIMTKLHKFDKNKAKFSTWSYRVCKSVLNRKYKQGSKYKSTFVGMAEGWDAPESERVTSAVLGSEITQALKELFDENPKNKHILSAIFGNPDSEQFVIPDSIDISHAAEKAGVDYGQAHAFYSRKIRPFFRKKFSREDFHARG